MNASALPGSQLRPQVPSVDYVGAVLDWLESRIPGSPLGAALVRDLGPPLVGWAVEQILGTSAPSKNTTKPHDKSWGLWAQFLRQAQRRPSSPPDYHAPRAHGVAELLMVSLQINSTRALLPVARELRSLGIITTFLLENEDVDSLALVKQAGFTFTLTSRGPTSLAFPRCTLQGIRLRRLWSDRAGLRELLTKLHLPHTPERELSLRVSLRQTILGSTIRGQALERTLRQCPARSVLFVTRRAFLDELLPHTHPAAKRFFFLQGVVPDVPPIRTPLRVERAIAGGRLDLPYLLRCGVEPSRIALTGYPNYDYFSDLDRTDCRQDYARARSLDPNRPWLVFTSQYCTRAYPQRAREKNLSGVLESARLLPQYNFIVKLHPRRESWQPKDLPGNVLIERSYDTPSLIKAADVMVTYWSTTALEALLLKTPLVQFNATGLPDFLTFPAELGIPIARSGAQLAAEIATAAERGQIPRDLLDRAVGPLPDGYAAKRAAEVLSEAMQS